MPKQPYQNGLIADEQYQHQHHHEVEQKHQQYTYRITAHKTSLLVVAVGKIHYHTVNGIGRQDYRRGKTYRQQAGVLVPHHVVDGIGQGSVNTIRHNVLQLKQQLILQPVERQEGNQREHEDKQRRQRHQERKRQPLCRAP